MEKQNTDRVLVEQLTATLGFTSSSTEYDEQGYLIKLDLSQLSITQLPEELTS